MIGALLDGIGHVIAWVWAQAPLLMSLLGLAVAVAFAAVVAHPRDRRDPRAPVLVVRATEPPPPAPPPAAPPPADTAPRRPA